MKKLLGLMLLVLAGHGARAQGFWAPGACWIYQGDAIGVTRFHHYQYVSDTVVDGMQAQVATYTLTEQIPNGPTTTWASKEYVTRQGNVVLYRTSFPLPPYPFLFPWDTLYVLGDVGERWWPPHADTTCSPLGMLEIQSVGTTTIDGITLASRGLAYLDDNGAPTITPFFISSDAFEILDRIGSLPRVPLMTSCFGDPWSDPETIWLRHYSDNEINYPAGTNCDISTFVAQRKPQATASVHPNPGTDQLTLSGLAPDAFIEVRDPLGRLMRSERSGVSKLTMHTADWPAGPYFVNMTDEEGVRRSLRWLKL